MASLSKILQLRRGMDDESGQQYKREGVYKQTRKFKKPNISKKWVVGSAANVKKRSSLKNAKSKVRKIRSTRKRIEEDLLSNCEGVGRGARIASARHCSNYENVSVSNSATAIVGNVYHHHHQHHHLYQSPIVQFVQPQSFASVRLQRKAESFDPFELISSISIDAYTLQNAAPDLFTCFGRSIALTPSARRDEFTMLYVRSRKCMQLTVSLTTMVGSKYWQLVESQQELHTDGISDLPRYLVSRIENHLNETQPVQQKLHLRILADKFGVLVKTEQSREKPAVTRPAAYVMRSSLPTLGMKIPFQSCAWYSEETLSRRQLYIGRQSNYFLTFEPSGGRWVLETRLSPDERKLRNQLYCLDIFRRLENQAGIAKFVGVVRDRNGVVVGFLSDLPSKGILRRVLVYAKRSGSSVSQERRTKWCRQLLQTVAEFHRSGLVVGMLGMQQQPPIAIDENDDAVLWAGFRPTLEHNDYYLGALPPECYPYHSALEANSKTDLFQLGLVLWRVAANKTFQHRVEFCKSADCTTPADVICHEPHTDPIALPMPEDAYPKCLRDIIDSCRSEDPRMRLPAEELLTIFPTSDSSDEADRKPQTLSPRYLPRPEQYLKLFGPGIYCERCPQICTHHYFHCGVCYQGAFDLCQPCFLTGEHCLDDNHILREFRSRVSEDRCYTKVQESGLREILFV